MATATGVIRQVYEAFGRNDMEAMAKLIAENVDWEFVGPPKLAYAGCRATRAEALQFFADVPKSDTIHAFEPREFIEAGEHLTVLGWEDTTALETGKRFQSEWSHVFTVGDGLVVRWRGFYNTAARHEA